MVQLRRDALPRGASFRSSRYRYRLWLCRAEALLEENFQARAAQKDESLGTYFALAGQAINGARAHLGRYRSFGISTTDASLPPEAVSDLNRLRSLLERRKRRGAGGPGSEGGGVVGLSGVVVMARSLCSRRPAAYWE